MCAAAGERLPTVVHPGITAVLPSFLSLPIRHPGSRAIAAPIRVYASVHEGDRDLADQGAIGQIAPAPPFTMD